MSRILAFFRTLTGKLFLIYFIVIIVPCSVMGALLSAQLSSNATNTFVEQRRELLLQMKDNINVYLTAMDRITESAFYDRGVLDYLSMDIERDVDKWITVQKELENFLTVSSSFSENNFHIYIVRNDNRIIAESPEQKIVNIEKEQVKWAVLASESNQLKMTDVSTDARFNNNTGKNVTVISYIKRIVDYTTRKPIGFIVVDMDFRDIEKMFDHISRDNNRSYFFVSRGGQTIRSADDTRNFPFISLMPEIVQNRSNPLYRKIDGKDYVFLRETLKMDGYSLVSAIPRSDAIYRQFSNVNVYLYVIAGIILLFAIPSTILISYNISKPVKRLIYNMKSAEKGNFDGEFRVAGSTEILELGQIYNAMIARIKALILDVQQKEQVKKEVEIQALQAQINPHFIYNTLSTIKWMAIIQKNNAIVQILTAFIDIMEYSAGFRQKMVTLEQEKNFIEKYIQIQEARYSGRVNYEIRIPDELLNFRIMKFIIEPVLENAYFHGLENRESRGEILLDVSSTGQTLRIVVEDNGSGMDARTLQELRDGLRERKDKGLNNIGLRNINDRIRENYGSPFGVDIQSAEGAGTRVTIEVPLISEPTDEG